MSRRPWPDRSGRHRARPARPVLRHQSRLVLGRGAASFRTPGQSILADALAAGLTPRLLAPAEERELLTLGLGITNVVDRATAAAAELTDDELRDGAAKLAAKVRRYEPRVSAILGVGAYRVGFGRPRANTGPQEHSIGATRIWVLPNPSGLNAHYQSSSLVAAFGKLREFLE